jgi:hypothetical protein
MRVGPHQTVLKDGDADKGGVVGNSTGHVEGPVFRFELYRPDNPRTATHIALHVKRCGQRT